MLKKLVNECRFTLTLETKSPFLIKDGRFDKDQFVEDGIIPRNQKEKYTNTIFVCLNTEQELKDAVRRYDYSNLKFYIPGTSLRGVIRSHAEKIVRTLRDGDDNWICCDLFAKDGPRLSCSTWLDLAKKKISKIKTYKLSCVICKLFGCTGTASRIQVHDSAISRQGTVGVRDGIGIDRFTGGVSSGANFKNQVLEGYTFQSEITIRNFEIWQLGLLAYVFRDFEQELLTLGFGKSKGFGRVKGTIGEIRIAYYRNKIDSKLTDLGDLFTEQIANYGFVAGNLSDDSLLQPLTSPTELTYRREFKVTNGDNDKFWKACAKVWNQAVAEGKFPSIPQLRAEATSAEQASDVEVNHG